MEPDYLALEERATADVERTCKPPAYSPLQAGFSVFVAAIFVTLVFAWILGLDTENLKVKQAMAIASALAGLATYFPLRSQEKKYWEARSRRLKELMAEAKQEKH